jgi:hypothetical protein
MLKTSYNASFKTVILPPALAVVLYVEDRILCLRAAGWQRKSFCGVGFVRRGKRLE